MNVQAAQYGSHLDRSLILTQTGKKHLHKIYIAHTVHSRGMHTHELHQMFMYKHMSYAYALT